MIISWNTTYECNLRCRHCYRDAGAKREGELSKKEGLLLLEEIANAGFKIVVFSGGEPLLRKDIYELIAHAKSLGIRPVLGTNGTLLTEDVAGKLKASGTERIGISLDSPDPEIHDEFRQRKGSYDATIAGIENCRKQGLEFQIHTTLMDFNEGDLERITDLAVNLGASAHHIFFVVPVGRAERVRNIEEGVKSEKLKVKSEKQGDKRQGIRDRRKELEHETQNIEYRTLKAERYEGILRRILYKQKEVGIELKPVCAPQFVRIAREMGTALRFNQGCLAGISYCCILPEGDLHPCPYLPVNCGNIREKGFLHIWQNSEVFKNLRKKGYSGKCGVCKYKEICGGCRASSFQYSGDYEASDPWCLYGALPGI
ncbi:MAG: radical SAM protein [bacterium]|nr:radical SAM protein [bacterium]